MCSRCAAPLPLLGRGTAACLYCQQRRYRFEATTALGIYRGRLREAVRKMKRSCHEPLSMAMSHLLADHVVDAFRDRRVDLVVPVPMFWWRRLFRGTNAPELLAEPVAHRLHAELGVDVVRCRRRAQKQGTLLPGQRFQNVMGAFRVSQRYNVAGSSVLVVDDVMTTGATVNAVAKSLLRGGAASVIVAVVARGVGNGTI